MMRYHGNPACVEARESLSDAPLERERITMHRNRCADCREHASREEEISRSLTMISARPLDDLARARIQARLAGDFDRLAALHARGKSVSRRWIALAVAAVLLALYLWPRDVMEPPRRDRLIPFLVAGTSQASLAPTDVIEAAAGVTIRAEAAGKGDLTLIGPGRVQLLSESEVSLERGLLLVHVSGPFSVRAGDLTVRVIGTRFSVDRREPNVRVSVSEGSVEVVREGSIAKVSRGEAWPNESKLEERLAAAQLAPPRDPSGVVVIGGTPAGAIAMLDGVALGPTPLIARLAAGEHRLEVQADLHQPHQRAISIPSGGVIDVSYALDPSRAPTAPPPRRKPKQVVAPVDAERAPETAEQLYRRAEEALASDRRDEARALLEDLAVRFSGDPLVESALYELARIDYAEGRLEEAHARLIRLLERRQDAAFAESGQRLLCQIDVETRRYDDANACWRSFRDRYPGSVHDAEALASLIALAQLWNDCARVKALAEEFTSRYPEHALASDVAARLRRCD